MHRSVATFHQLRWHNKSLAQNVFLHVFFSVLRFFAYILHRLSFRPPFTHSFSQTKAATFLFILADIWFWLVEFQQIFSQHRNAFRRSNNQTKTQRCLFASETKTQRKTTANERKEKRGKKTEMGKIKTTTTKCPQTKRNQNKMKESLNLLNNLLGYYFTDFLCALHALNTRWAGLNGWY